jgi:hypothetical protein
MPSPIEVLLQSHLQAAAVGVDAVMNDYSAASVLVTHEATYRGLAEIRGFFTTLLNGPTRGFIAALKLHRQDVAGDMAYIVWEAQPWFLFATDTFVFRSGKILFQTFSAVRGAE